MAKEEPKVQVRLLKVLVQPVVVVDDGENLQEVTIDPIVVTAKEWPEYATGRFKEQFSELQKQATQPRQ